VTGITNRNGGMVVANAFKDVEPRAARAIFEVGEMRYAVCLVNFEEHECRAISTRACGVQDRRQAYRDVRIERISVHKDRDFARHSVHALVVGISTPQS